MLKTASYRTLGFREYGMVNASNCKCPFTPGINPEKCIKEATKLTFIHAKHRG